MTGPARETRNQGGLTLIEMLVASFIFLIVLLASYNVIDASQKIARTQSEIADMDASGRVAIDLMSTEIREAGHNPGRLHPSMLDPPDVPFVSVRSDAMMGKSIDIRADLNGDGDTLDGNEYIRYEWEDPPVDGLSRLVRWVDTDEDGKLDQDSVLAENVKKTERNSQTIDIFTYLDSKGDAITTRADIPQMTRALDLNFTVQSEKRDRVTREYNEVTLQERVLLRNLSSFPR